MKAVDVLRDPLLNRGTAFTHEQRAELGELIASQIEEQQGQPQRALQFGRQRAGQDVGGAAGGERHDDAHRLARPGLRAHAGGRGQQRPGGEGGQRERAEGEVEQQAGRRATEAMAVVRLAGQADGVPAFSLIWTHFGYSQYQY